MFMNDSELIDELGGTAKVADLCEVSPAAVSQWRRDGIPRARRMYLKVACPDVFTKRCPDGGAPAGKAAQ